MYELVYLRKAFDAKTLKEIMHSITNDPPPEIESTYFLRTISNQ